MSTTTAADQAENHTAVRTVASSSATETPVDDLDIPVSRASIQECLRSVNHWIVALPEYATKEQAKADRFALAAGILAVLTGSSVVPVASTTSSTWWQVAVALPALAASVCAVFPSVRSYAEMAGRARELTSQYGPLRGALNDAYHGYDDVDQATLHALMKRFHQVKAAKDQLRRVPVRSTRDRRLTDPGPARHPSRPAPSGR